MSLLNYNSAFTKGSEFKEDQIHKSTFMFLHLKLI